MGFFDFAMLSKYTQDFSDVLWSPVSMQTVKASLCLFTHVIHTHQNAVANQNSKIAFTRGRASAMREGNEGKEMWGKKRREKSGGKSEREKGRTGGKRRGA